MSELIDHDLLRESIRAAVTSREGGPSKPCWPAEAWRALAEAGMAHIGVDADRGGSGGDLADAATVLFEAGRLAASLPLAETGHAARLAARHDLAVPTGPATVVVVPDGSLARTPDGGVQLDATVHGVPWGRAAEHLVVVGLVAGDPMPGDPVVLGVAARSATVVEAENLAGEPRDAVTFDHVVVGVDAWAPLDGGLAPVRAEAALLRGVEMAGAITAVLDLTTRYVREREQFGRPIARFQAVQQMLAVLAGEAAVSVMAVRAAVDALAGEPDPLPVLAANARVRRAAGAVARLAHQLHGAIGITEEYELHRWSNRLWSWRTEHGSDADWDRAVADLVRAGVGPSTAWAAMTDTGGRSWAR